MKRVEIESKRTLLDETFTVTETQLRFEQFNGQMSSTVRRLVFERGDSAGDGRGVSVLGDRAEHFAAGVQRVEGCVHRGEGRGRGAGVPK